MWGQILQGAGALAGGIGGSKGSSSGGMPKFQKKQFKRGFQGVNAAAERPATEAITPLNQDQNRAFDMVRGNLGLGRADTELAMGAARRAAGGVGAADIAAYYNPYEDQVIGSAMNDLELARSRASLGINSQAEAAGAFGGDRAVVANALSNEDFNRQMASMVSGLRYGGYNTAMDAAFRNHAGLISGAGSLLDGVGALRGDAYKDAAALAGVGETIRGYDQSLLDYPLLMAQAQIDAASAANGGSRSTTSGGGVSGAMSGALGGLDFAKKIGGVFGV